MGASRFVQNSKRNLPSGIKKNNSRKYIVERIVGHEGEKGLGGCIRYWVKWEGYPESSNTLEPLSSVVDSVEAVREYWEMTERMKKYDSRPKRGETYKSKKEASKNFLRLTDGLRSILKEDPGE